MSCLVRVVLPSLAKIVALGTKKSLLNGLSIPPSGTASLTMGKIKSQNQISEIISKLKKSGKKIIFTNGCFDILHVGHIKLLQKAKSFGDILIVGLNSDSSVKRIKSDGRPVIPEKERAEILSALNMVDFVVKFSDPTPYELIRKIKPDVLVKGSDWKSGKIVGSEFSKQVRRISIVKGRSTTKTIKKLKNLKVGRR